MSYVSVYENKTPRAKGVAMAAVVHAVIIAGVIAMPGIEIPDTFNGPFVAIHIPSPQPPEPVTKEQKRDVEIKQKNPRKKPSQPIIDLPPVATNDYSDLIFATGSEGAGDEIPFEAIEIAPDPVMVGASLNKRYAQQFQPAYPSGQLRMEREGEVSVRVLVGTDGRVKQIELIDSPHLDFWHATRKQALRKWRFLPATKDGRPFESWMMLKVRFEINS
ncbi:TonB family protein [Parasphingorhabdus sp.]|uniref:energy transducer TonB n=1 Tax=Parasphingorhabdus sp. TaxID=2709688 RepID=UPI003267EC74